MHLLGGNKGSWIFVFGIWGSKYYICTSFIAESGQCVSEQIKLKSKISTLYNSNFI